MRVHRGKLGISRIVSVAIIVVILVAVAGIAAYYTVMHSSNGGQNSTTISSNSSPLILYSADAYVAESQALETAFTNHTGIQTAPPKAGGSLLLGQQIAQGNPVSVFLSVSKTAVQPAVLKNQSAGWAVAFATDEMALGYSNSTMQNSAAVDVVNSYNAARSSNTTSAWFDFYTKLTSGSVKVGISNPNADPAGFRAWLVLQAAGALYAGNRSNYFVDRMLTNNGNVSGASAADLVAPLQAGQIQFLFIYKSAISVHHLELVELGSGVNLGDPSYDAFYSRFSYSTSSGVQEGSAIVLYLAVPKDSTNYEGSLSFVSFVVTDGASILQPFGLGTLTPARVYNDTSLPLVLSQLANQGALEYGGAL